MISTAIQNTSKEHADSSVKSIASRITLTGIDARTDLTALPEDVEIGILFSWRAVGNPRYPARSVIAGMLEQLKATHRTSLHVCGRKARDKLIDYALPDLTHNVDRIQVNGSLLSEDLKILCDLYSNHEIITQYRMGDYVGDPAQNHSLLVDASGGRGVLPDQWSRPATNKKVGFAGGISPDNILQVATDLAGIAQGDWWLDMESGIRDSEGWFCHDRANAVVAAVRNSHMQT